MGDQVTNPTNYEGWNNAEPWLQVPSPNSWPKPQANAYVATLQGYPWGEQLSSDIEAPQEQLETPYPSNLDSLTETWSNTWGVTQAELEKNTKLTLRKACSFPEPGLSPQKQAPAKTAEEDKQDGLDSLSEEDLSGLSPAELAERKKKKTAIEEELSKQSLYKTELCRSYQDTGVCRYGHKCQFAHGEHELRPILRHPKYKTEYCQRFAMFGNCPYGNRCRFIHPEGMKSRRSSEPLKKTISADPSTKNIIPLLDLSKASITDHASSGPSTPNSDPTGQGWSSSWTSTNSSPRVGVVPAVVGSVVVPPETLAVNPILPPQVLPPEANPFLHPWMLNRRASSESSLLPSMPPVMKPPTTYVERNTLEGRRLNVFQNLSNTTNSTGV